MGESKKARAKRHAAATVTSSGFSPAQETMRQDMLGEALDRNSLSQDRKHGPQPLRAVLDGELGEQPTTDPDIKRLAYQVINNHPDVVFNLSQWAQVQAMIEEGIVAGLQVGRLGQG